MGSLFDAERLRASLKPWEHTEEMEFNSHLVAYTKYYGIDYANQIQGLKHRIGYFDAVSYRVVMQSFLPPNAKGTVLVCHGYYDHVGIFNHVIHYALNQGYAVIAYDLPGHGLSSGPIVAIKDFHEYQVVLKTCLALVKGIFPEPWHVIAQSTGAAVIIDFLLSGRFDEESSPFKKVVMFAPLIRPINWKFNKGIFHLMSPFKDYIVRKFSFNSNNPHFLRFLRQDDPLQSRRLSSRWVKALIDYIDRVENAKPVAISPLILQGDLDGTVDLRRNIPLLVRKFLDPKIVIMEGARHHVANESEEIRAIVFDNITKYFNQ